VGEKTTLPSSLTHQNMNNRGRGGRGSHVPQLHTHRLGPRIPAGQNGGGTCGRGRGAPNAAAAAAGRICTATYSRQACEGKAENNHARNNNRRSSSASASNGRSSTTSVISTQQGPPSILAGRGQQQRRSETSGNKRSSTKTTAAQPQKQVDSIDPKNWAQSSSKAFLRKELLQKDSVYWTLTPKAAYTSKPELFSPFKYENFVTNFRNLKRSIKCEVEAISFDDEAVKKELAAFPLAEVDRRGNKRFHNHPAKQLLIDDIKNGAGKTYFNRPRDLRETKDEYKEFNKVYFRKQFNRQKQREKEVVGWQYRRNLKGARNNIQRVSEGA